MTTCKRPSDDPDNREFMFHIESVEGRIVLKLREATMERPVVHEGDMAGHWESLQCDRSLADVLIANIHQMQGDAFIDVVDPPKDVLMIIEKYWLD